MTGSADQPTTTTPASETNTNTNTSTNSSDPAQPRQAPDQQQDGSDQQLSSLCSSLQVTAAAANDGLRDLLVSAPLTRQSIVKLSQELVEIQTAARLYIRHSSVAEAAPGSDADIARGGDPSIPRPVLEDVTKLVRCTLDLLSEVMDTLDSSSQQGSNGASRRQLAGHAEAILPRLVDLTTPAQLARTALNLGLDAMALYVFLFLLFFSFSCYMLQFSLYIMRSILTSFAIVALLPAKATKALNCPPTKAPNSSTTLFAFACASPI